MIRLQTIQDALFPLVGWRQGLSDAQQIAADLTASESGLYYDGAHPLVTLANIASILPKDGSVVSVLPGDDEYNVWEGGYKSKGKYYAYNKGIFLCIKSGSFLPYQFPTEYPENFRKVEEYKENFSQYSATTSYKAGAIVTLGTSYYRALVDNRNIDPASNPDVWERIEGTRDELYTITWAVNLDLDAAVRRYMEDGIATMVNRFIADKQLTKETRSLLERRTFFDGAARLQATIAPTGKLCGFEIVPVRSMGVTTKIERIGLQMVGNTGSVTLYLFHSSQVAPMRTMTFNYTNTSGGFQWFVPAEDLYLPYISSGNDSGGAWLLCYNQNDLPVRMRALNVSKDWSKEPCATCSGYSLESWREITKYLQVSPFCTDAPDGFAQDPQMPDIGELGYTNTMNYGMNVEVSVQCDLTDFIVSQRHIFAPVLQKQVAANILRTLAMNPDVRVNRNQANVTRDGMLYELDGNPQGRAGGLVYELERLYKALSLDTRGLDRICLQCNNGGVRYRTV